MKLHLPKSLLCAVLVCVASLDGFSQMVKIKSDAQMEHEQIRYEKNLKESESERHIKCYIEFIDALNKDIKVCLEKGIQTWKNENPIKGYSRCSPNQIGIFWNNAHPQSQQLFESLEVRKLELGPQHHLWGANPK